MIFEPIKYVENKDFFLELIDTYIRLVEVTAERNKMVIPQTRDTKVYIESVLEERERENTFVLKSLKNRKS